MAQVTREYLEKLKRDVKGTGFSRNIFLNRIFELLDRKDKFFDIVDEDKEIIDLILSQLNPSKKEPKKKSKKSIFKEFEKDTV